MDPLRISGSIIAVLSLSAKVLKYLNCVKDAPKDRAQCAIVASNLSNLLWNLRYRLEEGDPAKPWYIAIRALAIENGPLDQFKEALETLQTRMTDGGRLKKAQEALVWRFKKDEIREILERMEHLKKLIEIALQMNHFLTPVRTFLRDVEERRHLDWISPTDYPAQQSDNIRRRQQGTSEWILKADETVQWFKQVNRTLFCTGIPGAGKTIVATIVIDHLLQLIEHSGSGVAYDDASMLATNLKQLMPMQSRWATTDLATIRKMEGAHQLPGSLLKEILGDLRKVMAEFPTVYIIVDALDECRDACLQTFLAQLGKLRKKHDIRFMATSREIPGIVDAFKGALQLEIMTKGEDVRLFVAGQTDQLPRCIQRDPVLQNMVQEAISKAVGGMYDSHK
ncbi:hypothetical protein P154DRAFT_549673 [Amniculicola lignicola CBS 123094]|uniref:Nephrocystin 3-like N-terminal domain-containing protein n=1 Tax=Amniculicola lignicola CBS 123094 TaxID=1392246 RepID=A0A6A5VUR5_9PLEO|nr:hypothetical protein P154DRAFT_549673 [Amniculicola lignicola CBS 123094]